MELMNQPFTGQLGNRLIELLNSRNYQTLNIVVAFAKNSGVLRIKEALENFRNHGGEVNVYVGVDLGGTSYEALTNLLLLTDTLTVVHAEKGQTFHPKIYQFLGDEEGLIIVGSHNLTGGGLWTNFESSVHIPTTSPGVDLTHVPLGLDGYFEQLALLEGVMMPIDVQDDVDKLLLNGYVLKEVSQKIREAKASKRDGAGERLFGNGAPAKLPSIAGATKEDAQPVPPAASTPLSLPESDEGDTIWFETREMTGGSRNILDLSKRSLITRGDPRGTRFDLGDPRFMRGAVEFFGINPEDTGQIIDITLNFEGVDYVGNTILYPVGQRPNGTWRLQIKGISATGEKITDAFRNKGAVDYLVQKVVTFTRVHDEYYFLSVFPVAHIEAFEDASRILARNGSTNGARELGLL